MGKDKIKKVKRTSATKFRRLNLEEIEEIVRRVGQQERNQNWKHVELISEKGVKFLKYMNIKKKENQRKSCDQEKGVYIQVRVGLPPKIKKKKKKKRKFLGAHVKPKHIKFKII